MPASVEGAPGVPPKGAGVTVPEKVADVQFNEEEAVTESASALPLNENKTKLNRASGHKDFRIIGLPVNPLSLMALCWQEVCGHK